MSSEEKRILLGELIARTTKMLGIAECGGCAKRREALNRVRLDKGVGRAAAEILEAITNPQVEGEEDGSKEDNRTEARPAEGERGEGAQEARGGPDRPRRG